MSSNDDFRPIYRLGAWAAVVTLALVPVQAAIFAVHPPPTVGLVEMIVSFASLVPLAVWLVLVARRLFQLGSDATNERPLALHPHIA